MSQLSVDITKQISITDPYRIKVGIISLNFRFTLQYPLNSHSSNLDSC